MEITLALGGGGIKGFAHVGVLRFLEREGFQVRAIAGTSAGGLVGALYACGYTSREIANRLTSVDQSRLFHRLPGDGPSLMGLGGVTEVLREMLGDRTFEELCIPLVVTAVDLERGAPVTLCRGRLMDALLATCAVPGIFPPKEMDGRFLVDGGVLNPVPVALARSLSPRLPVVAVVLSPHLPSEVSESQMVDPEVAGTVRTERAKVGFIFPGGRRRWLSGSFPLLYQLAGRLRLAQAFNIFLRSVDIGAMLLTELRLDIEKPDVIIRPRVHQVGLLDPVDVEEMIRLGEESAVEQADALRQAVSWPARLARRVLPPRSATSWRVTDK